MSNLPVDFAWWLSAVELPVLAGLFWLQQRQREQSERAVEAVARDCRLAIQAVRAALADYKLEVAQGYASVGALKDVETRLTEHLLRIEAKLDQASMQQHALTRF
jgi:type II secretory pathway pseudopilin PulG